MYLYKNNNMTSEFIKVIFGDYTVIQLFGFVWFLIIGYIIYALNETTLRDVQSMRTPIAWSWSFWYKDNWRRYIVTILSTYILFRFYVQFVGTPLTDFQALMLGLVGDGIGATAKKRINLAVFNRKQMMNQEYDHMNDDQAHNDNNKISNNK